jgi:uncharacterized protein (TIGR03083 family)
MSATAGGTDLGALYETSRVRLTALIESIGSDADAAPVPGCPAWAVRDVVAHLAATAEDAVAGKLTGPPDEAMTAAQVDRFAGVPVDELLGRWADASPPMVELVGAFRVWPAVIDVVTHEHDVRGAVGRPGARDSDAVAAAARALLHFQPPAPLVVRMDGHEARVGPPDGPPLVLETGTWETLRWRMGRRSRRQLAAMRWSGDPAGVLDALVVFGPSTDDIIE